MSTLSLDLDFNFPTDIPDLPPPWPPTDVAIEWWLQREGEIPSGVPFEERLAYPHRGHSAEPFVMD